MAISLNTLRSAKQTSIHGRRLALDQQDFLVGPKGLREAVVELTSASTAQTLGNYGFNQINVTSAVTTATNAFFIPNPTPGSRVSYSQGVSGTTSTQGSTSIALQRATTAFYIESSEGTTNIGVLLPFGTVVELLGMTTDRYKVANRVGVATTLAAAVSLTGTS